MVQSRIREKLSNVTECEKISVPTNAQLEIKNYYYYYYLLQLVGKKRFYYNNKFVFIEKQQSKHFLFSSYWHRILSAD